VHLITKYKIMKIVNNKKEIFNMKRLVLLFLFLPAAYFASGQMPGTPYGVRNLDCSDAPATPGTITLSATTVNLNGTFKASVPEITTGTQKPTSYSWTLPSGLSGTSSSREITITGATAGTYAAGEIKVKATNACGTSSDKTSASAVTVRNCSAAPTQPGAITIPASVAVNTNFTARITAVSGATGYTWNTPAGLTIVSGQNTTTVTYKASSAGTIASGAITVTADNACGNSNARTSASAILVNPPACSAFTISSGVYSGPAVCSACEEGLTLSDLVNGASFTRTTQTLCLNSEVSDTKTSYAVAAAACAALSTDGANDWRLPNIAEMLLITKSASNYNIKGKFYLTSTEFPYHALIIVIASTQTGSWATEHKAAVGYGASYRCVRNL
jgi:hypothetical protein